MPIFSNAVLPLGLALLMLWLYTRQRVPRHAADDGEIDAAAGVAVS